MYDYASERPFVSVHLAVAVDVFDGVLFCVVFFLHESSCLFYLSFNFDFCVSKIMHL